MMEELNDKFYYVYSGTLFNRIQIKIGTLEGQIKRPEYDKLLADPTLKYSGLCEEGYSDLLVTCQVFDQNNPLTIGVSTSYKAFTNRWSWNEWLTLPVQYSDLPRTAQLALTIYVCTGPSKMSPIGGTTISLFSKHGLFRQGMVDLRVFPNREADGSSPSQTPGKTKDRGKEQMQKLTKLTKKHRNGYMTKVDWLDRLTFRELGLINNQEKSASNYLYLMIEFPTVIVEGIPHYVVYFEQGTDEIHSFRAPTDVITVPDAEILKENLVERKHHKLARSLRSGICDKDAKPNAAIRDILHTIVQYPSTKVLSNEEQDHVWKFRFYLSNQKKALAKFLKCVNWTQQNEVRQAVTMMKVWAPMDPEDALELLGPNFTHHAVRRYAISRLQQAPDEDILLYLLQLVQALKFENFKDMRMSKLLGVASVPAGHEYIPDEDTSTPDNSRSSARKESQSTITTSDSGAQPSSSLSSSLQQSLNSNLQQSLNSSLNLQQSMSSNLLQQSINSTLQQSMGSNQTDQTVVPTGANEARSLESEGAAAAAAAASEPKTVACVPDGTNPLHNVNPYTDSANTDTLRNNMVGEEEEEESEVNLATFLIQRACKNPVLGNYLYWYLLVECEDPDSAIKQNAAVREMYVSVLKSFSQALLKGTPEMQRRRLTFSTQQKLIDNLIRLLKVVLRESADRQKKTQRLQELLNESPSSKFNFLGFDPIPFPLDPSVVVKGIIPEKSLVYKSALTPCRLHFITNDPETEFITIFKHGDDLRQDQLVLQMISLMDKLLRKENLDLKLSPYGVLATSTKHGFVRYVKSTSINELSTSDGSILTYLKKFHPQENGPMGLAPEVMNNYVRSCAGYCVITYILGVGDRHLDNLMLTPDGKLFHIDFGYILGRDPKPLPPPMKLTKEMVEAMGGISSENFQEFKNHCVTAFCHLRRHANLVLNLFALMVEASVPDIALEPDKAVKKVQEKFFLDKGEEESVHQLLDEVYNSISSFMPVIVDKIHTFAQYIRK